MKFSVLVPVYNVEKYLEQCIYSVLSQTYQNFELILVDDGSKDESGLMCDKFAKKYPDRIKVVHKENQGLISARRVGIANATGDFCIFLDSDDSIESDLLEIIESYLKKDEMLDMLLYSFYYNRNGKREERKRPIAPNESSWEGNDKKELYEKLLYTADITSMCTKAIRTSILKGEETDYAQYYGKDMAEDLLQSLYPMTVARKILFIDKPLYVYQINDASISRSFRPETISKKNTLHVYEMMLDYLPIWNLDNCETRQRLEARWFHETMYFMTKYYEGAVKKEDRKAILQYDWSSMLPEQNIDLDNTYLNAEYKKLYLLLEEKAFRDIERYFRRKKCYRKLREWKRKVLHSS